MTNEPEIQARLERSLRSQITAPRLDSRFDAAVWARITAERPRAAPRRAPRWLFWANVMAIIATVVLVLVSGLRSLAGIDVNAGLAGDQAAALTEIAVWLITAAAIGFGLLFTPRGRRLRSQLT